ncbi:phosphatase PAP2 family protein [Fibrobacter intestinalis]|uniref:phosphatase PAP2 family protein n=2 Tax=Fibrobacter TaxID=832 RepID=UPI0023F31F41|nr:phosphatase PAP2 family protein [Fibrobacter intestinalis]MDD7299507.1 phosphatase PAP2 family protein [Fibrobacter intestinalis]
MKMLQEIAKIDEYVSRRLYSHRFSEKTDRWLRRYTRLGDGYVWGVIVLWILWSMGWKPLLGVLLQVFPSLVMSLALYWLVKLSVKRRRPFEVIAEFQARVPPLDKYSFPSGHTMNNLAIATTLLLSVPAAGLVMMALPLSWGFLRVYFGVHWLSDVVGGFLLGIVSFVLGRWIWVVGLSPLVSGCL